MRFRILPILANLLMVASLCGFGLLHQVMERAESGAISGIPAMVRVYALGIAGSHAEHYGLNSEQIDKFSELAGSTIGVGGGLVGAHKMNMSTSGISRPAYAELIAGNYFDALHIRPEVGRLMTLQQVRNTDLVAVIDSALARVLFKAPSLALGHVISVSLPRVAITVRLRIVAVLPEGVHGVGATNAQLWFPIGVYALLGGQKPSPSKQRLNITGTPAFVTFPADYSRTRIQSELVRLTQKAQEEYVLSPNQRLITAYPYSNSPHQNQHLMARMNLYLLVTVLGALFTAVNALTAAWLVAVRNAPNQSMLRIMGMTHRALLSISAIKAGKSFLALTIIAVLLITFALTALRPELIELGITPTQLPSLGWRIATFVLPSLLVLMGLQSLAEIHYGWREPASVGAMRNIAGMCSIGTIAFLIEIFFVSALSIAASWSGLSYYRFTHSDIGFLKRPSTIVHVGLRKGYGALSMSTLPPDVNNDSNRIILDAIDNAVAPVDSLAQTGIGPAPGERDASFPGIARNRASEMQVCLNYISPGWIEAAQVSVLAGQSFSRRNPDPKSVVIDSVIARHFFKSTASAIGHWLDIQTLAGGLERFEIKGVLHPVKLGGAAKQGCPTAYLNLRDHGDGAVLSGYGNLLIYPKIEPALRPTLIRAIDRALLRVTPMLQVNGFSDTDILINKLYAPQRRLATILFSVATFTWLVALIALAVMLRLHYDLQKRMAAIRSALGAGPRRLYGEVLGGTLALALAGIALSLLAAPWLAQQFAFLSGAQVAPFGAATWIALGVLLLAVFLVAHFPARRAAHAEPAESLHEL